MGNPAWVKGGPSPNPNGPRGNKSEALVEAEKLLEVNAPLAVRKLLKLMECGNAKIEAFAAATILKYTVTPKPMALSNVIDVEAELPVEELKRLASGS